MIQKKLKKIFIIFIFLLLFFLLFYFFVFVNHAFSDSDSDSDSLFIQFYDDEILELSNKLPLSDELGKSGEIDSSSKIIDYTSFSITNNKSKKVNYEIYATKENTENEIRGDYIIYYLTDDNDNPLTGYDNNILPTYSSLLSLSNKPYSRLLYSGIISGGEKKSFKLKTWVSDSYTISDNLENFRVNIYVGVK